MLAGRGVGQLRLAPPPSDLESQHARVREALEHALPREHRLSLSEYEVLRRLDQTPEGHRLEDDGYVSRAVCAHDRRGVFACVTEAGRKAAAEAHPTQVTVLAETLG